jgi:hypothetical protein
VTKQTEIPDWETLLAHAALLQTKIPAAILVGGTAAAVHAGYRISFDHDHVVRDLAKNYDAAILLPSGARCALARPITTEHN